MYKWEDYWIFLKISECCHRSNYTARNMYFLRWTLLKMLDIRCQGWESKWMCYETREVHEIKIKFKISQQFKCKQIIFWNIYLIFHCSIVIWLISFVSPHWNKLLVWIFFLLKFLNVGALSCNKAVWNVSVYNYCAALSLLFVRKKQELVIEIRAHLKLENIKESTGFALTWLSNYFSYYVVSGRRGA